MIAALFLSIVLSPDPCAALAPLSAQAAQGDSDLNAKIAAAGRDVAKLLELASALSAGGKEDAAKTVYKKVLEIDAANEAAHKGLRHQLYAGKWFDSFAELSKYKREEAAKMKAKGLVLVKEEWVSEADAPFVRMGWAKDEHGHWAHPDDLARAKQAAEWKSAHYEFRADDNSWVAPAEKAQWTALLWKCGDQWVDMAKANEYHAQLGQWWELDGEHFTVWTTCDWDAGNLARWHAEQAYAQLVRLFGIEPASKPSFIVLNGLAQYNQVAGGNPPLIAESDGFSSLHGGYFADRFVDFTAKPPKYLGAGVSYWDRKDEKLRAWGPYWLRWAAAQSFCEAIDPSWNAVSELIGGASGGAPPNSAAFWAEKKIPRWMRYGAASYVERFMKNPEAGAGGGMWDLRKFAFAEIKKSGGLHKLSEIFEFGLDLAKPEDSTRLYHEAGLLVAFLLDGADGDKKLVDKHKAFQAALKSGVRKDVDKAVEALQKELAGNERDIKEFAEL